MRSIIFHHRIPTCNMNVPRANHPLFITSKKNLSHKYFIVHNGMISNSNDLREIHEGEGFKYKSEISWYYTNDKDKIFAEHTDTESLGIEMAKFIEQNSSHIKCKGGAAVFMLEIDKNNTPINFYAFRQTNPIKWFRNQNGIFLASEAKGSPLDERKLFRVNLETLKVSQRNAELMSYQYMGQDYKDKDYEVLPDGGFTEIEKKNIPVHLDINASAIPLDPPSATVTSPHGHSEHRSGNILFLPKQPLLNPVGFHRLKKNSPLSNSLRTYSDMEKELKQVEDILGDIELELFDMEETGEELHTEYYYNLKQRHKRFIQLQEEILLEMDILPK